MKNKKRLHTIILFASLLLTAQASMAQVKRVQMHISGYLCGN
jgi:hypothetical protein